MSQLHVIGLGNALMDVLYPLETDDVLVSESLFKGTMHQANNDRWQAVYKNLDPSLVTMQTGGSCANTIATLGLLGAEVSYCGQVGDDDIGQKYTEQLLDCCGRHALHTVKGQPTGKCLSLISKDGERTMITDLGTAVNLQSVSHVADAISQSQILHLTGYLLLGDITKMRMEEAIAMARSAGIKISLDVADPFVVNALREPMLALIKEHIDIVFLNEEEAKALFESSAEDAFEKLQSFVDVAVVKLGKKGSMVFSKGEKASADIFPVEVVDTTGAGDSYAAGFLYGHITGMSLKKSAELASRVASACVSQFGAVVRDRETLASTLSSVLETP